MNLPNLTMPTPDSHVVNRETSLAKAYAVRKAVVASIENGLKQLSPDVKSIATTCLEEVLASQTQASYWCQHNADDQIEKDIFAKVQMRMKRKMAGSR